MEKAAYHPMMAYSSMPSSNIAKEEEGKSQRVEQIAKENCGWEVSSKKQDLGLIKRHFLSLGDRSVHSDLEWSQTTLFVLQTPPFEMAALIAFIPFPLFMLDVWRRGAEFFRLRVQILTAFPLLYCLNSLNLFS